MNLEKLINSGILEEFKGTSIEQIERKLKSAVSYYDVAKYSIGKIKEEDNLVIYTNLYHSAIILADTFLLLKGYRFKKRVSNHHTILIQTVKLLMDDPEMNEIFIRLARMQKDRNKIDYDAEALDISEPILTQAIQDIKIFTDKIRGHIQLQQESE